MKLSDISRDKRILIMGASGVGKTHIIGTLCRIAPTLVVTSDVNGLETLASMGINPEVVFIQDWKRCWDYYQDIVKAMPGHKAIAVDDFGSIQVTARHKIEAMPKGAREEKIGTREFAAQAQREMLLGERTMELRDWGKMWVALETFMYSILNLPFDIKLFTVIEGVARSPRDGEEHIYPNLQGAIRQDILARFGLVAEAFIISLDAAIHYALTCRSHPRIETKDRYGQGRTWLDPDMLKVLAYINGRGGEESTEEKRVGVGLSKELG